MKVIRMDIPEGDAITKAFATFQTNGSARVEIGMALLRVGERVPPEGASRHQGIEVSYVLRGVVDVVNAEGTKRIAPGDLVIVPTGEWHYSCAVEEAALVYAFLEDGHAGSN